MSGPDDGLLSPHDLVVVALDTAAPDIADVDGPPAWPPALPPEKVARARGYASASRAASTRAKYEAA